MNTCIFIYLFIFICINCTWPLKLEAVPPAPPVDRLKVLWRAQHLQGRYTHTYIHIYTYAYLSIYLSIHLYLYAVYLAP